MPADRENQSDNAFQIFKNILIGIIYGETFRVFLKK